MVDYGIKLRKLRGRDVSRLWLPIDKSMVSADVPLPAVDLDNLIWRGWRLPAPICHRQLLRDEALSTTTKRLRAKLAKRCAMRVTDTAVLR